VFNPKSNRLITALHFIYETLDDPLFNEDVLNLVKYRENQELIDAFKKVKKLDLDKDAIKKSLTIDIIKSIHQLNETYLTKNKTIKKHALYVVIGSEHDPECVVLQKKIAHF